MAADLLSPERTFLNMLDGKGSVRYGHSMGARPSQSYLSLVSTLLSAFLLVGCATKHAYWGEHRPESDTALIRGHYFQALFYWSRCGVLAVDGVKVKSVNVRLLPGPHRLVVAYNRVALNIFCTAAEETLDIDVVAGAEYELNCKKKDGNTLFGIFHKNTGQNVSHPVTPEGAPTATGYKP